MPEKPTVSKRLLRAITVIVFLGLSMVFGAEEPLITATLSFSGITANQARIILTHHTSLRGTFLIDPSKNTVEVTDTALALLELQRFLGAAVISEPNIRLDILFAENDQQGTQQIGIDGALGTGQDGLTVRGREKSSQTQHHMNQFVLVRNGTETYFSVENLIPQPAYLLGLAQNQGLIPVGPVYQAVGSRVAVQAWIEADNHITVKVTPQISTLADGNPQIISYRNLATIVTVPNGGTLQVGGFEGGSSNFDQSFFYNRGQNQSSNTGTFTLRATIDGTDPGADHDLSTRKRVPLGP